MKKYSNINNIGDLNRHLAILKTDYIVREELLKRDAVNYAKQFTPGNLIKRFLTPSKIMKADDKFNISSKLVSWALPLIINSTIFRGSGMITKALVGIASNKIGKNVDADHIAGWISTVKSWIGGSKSKNKKARAYVDYGIPPDSETY